MKNKSDEIDLRYADRQPENVPLPVERLAPHNYDMELALVGLALIDMPAFDIARASVSADDFFILKFALVWNVMNEMRAENLNYNPETVSYWFQRKPETDRVDHVDINNMVLHAGFSFSMNVYIRSITEDSIRRKMISSASEQVKLAQLPDMPISDVIDLAKQSLDTATYRIEPETSVSFGRAIRDAYAASQEALSNKDLPEYQSGLEQIDKLLSKQRFRKGKFYLVAGRPGMGKTDLLLHLARRFSRQGKRVKMFEMEMAKEELASRITSAETKIPVDRIENGDMSIEEWREYTELVADSDYFTLDIDDTAEINMNMIESRSRKHTSGKRPEVIIIDYLQLIAVKIEKNGNREQAVAAISRWAKVTARKLNVILIMGCQLNRKTEERADKRPTKADLRESGSLEQDADVVFGLYRDEEYNPNTVQKNVMEVLFMKNRGGPRGVAKIYYNAPCHSFGNLKKGQY